MAPTVTLAGGALAAYLSTCAPRVSPDTMRAIVGVESGGNAYALHDNTTRRAYAPRDARTALAIATVLLRRGDSVDVGLAQVNSANFAAYHADTATMLQPCENLIVASRILVGDYVVAAGVFPAPRDTLWHAISAYNTGSLFAGRPYVDAVVAEAMRSPTVPTISLLTKTAPQFTPLTLPAPASRMPVARHRPQSRSHRRSPAATPFAAGFAASVRSAGIERSLGSGVAHGAI